MSRPIHRVGLTFESVESLRMTLRQYAIHHSFVMEFLKNDNRRITANCASKNYSWRLHASTLKDKKTMAIKKSYTPPVNVTISIRQ